LKSVIGENREHSVPAAAEPVLALATSGILIETRTLHTYGHYCQSNV
jgi:hypothetical protein